MANALAVELHAAGIESASGNGSAIDIGPLRSCLKLQLDLTALASDAKLTCYVETASAANGPWKPVQSFPALTIIASKAQVFADCLRYVRVRWVLDGDSANFAIAGQAHVLYAKVADVGVHAIPAEAIKGVPVAEQAACCLAATDEADGYLGAGKTLPLTAWGDDLTAQVAQVAAYKIVKRRGFQPEGADDLIIKGRDDAISWLRGVARGDIEPSGMVDTAPETYEAGIVVYSDVPTDSGGQYW